MIGNLNTRQVRNLYRNEPCRKVRYDHMSSVQAIGSEIKTSVADGWYFVGASIKDADGGGKYLLVRWRREIAL